MPRTRERLPAICICGATAWLGAGPTSVILADAEDFEVLAQRPWQVDAAGYPRSQRPYVRLHRLLLGLEDSSVPGDHKNGNPADCRRSNLRIVTPAQNAKNRGKIKRGSSAYKGVTLFKGRWQARIMADKRSIFLGYFNDEQSAALAYDKAAREHHGEFARTNF